jgi:Flp pilus assembly protein TadD
MVQRRSPLVPAQEAVDILKALHIISQVDANSSYIREEVEKRSRTLLYSDIEDPEERFIAAAPGVIHTLIKKGTIEEKKIDEAMDRLEEVFPGVSYYGVLLLIAAYILEKGREKGFTAKPAMIYSQLIMAGASDRDELLASFDGDVEKAVKSLELSIRSLGEIENKDELADNKFMLALMHNYAGRTDEAEKEYSEVIQIKPDYAGAHNNIGILLDGAGRTEEAEAEYREALRVKPDYAGAHNNLGILLDDLERTEEAEMEYREALRVKPDYAGAHNNLGVLLYDAGRKEEAEAEYREALRLKPNYAEAHGNLGILYSETGKKEATNKELEIAKSLFEAQGRAEDVKKAEALLNSL